MELCALLALALAAQPQPAALKPLVFDVDASKVVGECDPLLWANIGYDPMWMSTLDDSRIPFWAFVRENRAIRRVRCHNTFTTGLPMNPGVEFPLYYHGCGIVELGPDGKPRPRFECLDDVLDLWVAVGIDPIIELDFMPDLLADGRIRRSYGGGAVNAPRDYRAWQEMIRATVQHMVDRYGLETVRRWRFELWNEPDLPQYFIDGGTVPRGVSDPNDPRVQKAVARLCRMYDHAAAAVKSVDAQLKVGGPGLAGFTVYLAAFVQHCASGTNAVTGGRGAPLDFISWHCYAYVPGQLGKIAEIRRAIAAVEPKFLELELQENEWGQPLRRRDPRIEATTMQSFEAANLCKMIRAMWDNPERSVDLFLRWGQPVGAPTSMGWRRLSIATASGKWAPTAVLRAYALLARLGPQRLAASPTASGPAGILAARSDGGVQVVIYHADERNPTATAPARRVIVRLRGLPFADGPVTVEHYRLDFQHGDVMARLSAMPRPARGQPLPAEQIDRALAAAENFRLEKPAQVTVRGGEAELSIDLPPNAVSFLFLGRTPKPDVPAPDSPLLLRVLRGMGAYGAALELASQGNADQAAAKMVGVAKRYADLVWGWKAWWWLARYHAQAKRPAEALAAVEHVLARRMQHFNRAQLLQWAADRAAEAGDQARCERYLRQLEELLNSQGASRRWLVGAPPRPRGRPVLPETLPTGLRAGQTLRFGAVEVTLKPAARIVSGYAVAGETPGRGPALGVVKVKCPSARPATVEFAPWAVGAVWCNGELVYRMARRRAQARTYLYADLRLKAGTNEIAVLSVRGPVRARILDAQGQPMRDIQFVGP